MSRQLRLALGGLFLSHPLTGSGQYTLGLVAGMGEGKPHPQPPPQRGEGAFGLRAGFPRLLPCSPPQRGEGLGVRFSLPYLITDRPTAVPAGWQVRIARPPFGRVMRHPRLNGLAENLDKVWFEQVGLPRAAARVRADVLHYPYFAAPLRSRVPVVVTVHDLIPLLLPEYRGSALVRLYMRLAAAGARRARLILADSAWTRDDVVRVLGVPAERVRVVPLAVDGRYRPVAPEVARAAAARYGLGERFVLNVGGFDARKNVPRLIEAFAELRRRGYPGELALAGRLPAAPSALFPDVRGLAERLGVAGAVRWLGPISDEDKIALYRACEVMVYPSLYEGFGLPPLEAMACGAAVVTSRVSSLPEVVGEAALTVEPTDVAALVAAIQALVDEPSRRQVLGVRGRARAAGFTWAKTVEQTLAALTEAAGTGAGAGVAPCAS